MDLNDIIGYPLLAIGLAEIVLGGILLRPGPEESAGRRVSRLSALGTAGPRAAAIRRSVAVFVLVIGVDTVAGGLVYAAAREGRVHDLLYRFTWFAWLSVPAGLQLLCAVHGERRRLARAAVAGLYGLWVVVLSLVVATDWIEQTPIRLFPFEDRTGPLESAVRIVGSVQAVALALLTIVMHRRARGQDRLRLSYFLLGALVFAVGGTLNSILPPLMGSPPLDPALASYFTPPTVLLLFVSVTRYRLRDARTLLSRALALLALLVPAGAIHTGLFLALDDVLAPTGAVIVAFCATAVLLLATPVRRWLRIAAEALVRRQRDRDRHHALMREAARAVVTLLSADDLIAHLASVVRRGLGASSVAVYVAGEDAVPVLRHAVGGPPGGFPETLGASLIASARHVGAAPVPIFLGRPASGDAEDVAPGFGGMLALPLRYQDSLQGVVLVGARVDGAPFVHEDFDVLETLGYQAAIALANARLYHEATTDDLTGLYHRRFFFRRLADEVERARVGGRSLAVMLIDIDRFKRVNDTFGHAVGDQVLRSLAGTVQGALRHPDTAARLGGEEFAVLLCDVDTEKARGVAERIRLAVEEARHAGSQPVTISVGVAVHTPERSSLSPADIVATADAALYEAKGSGRNRVCLRDADDGVPACATAESLAPSDR